METTAITPITATTQTTHTETTSDNMDQETLFTASKWDILTALENQRRSPLELANILNTSAANISQQLRLLEMAGLVQSKRISNREKGLPRVLYSLAGNHSYIIAAAKEFVEKKLHKLTERNKVSLRIWFLDKPELHYYLEKAFWKIDEQLPLIKGIYLDPDSSDLILTIVSDDSKLKLNPLKIKNPDGDLREINFKILNENEFNSADKNNLYTIFDPNCLLSAEERD